MTNNCSGSYNTIYTVYFKITVVNKCLGAKNGLSDFSTKINGCKFTVSHEYSCLIEPAALNSSKKHASVSNTCVTLVTRYLSTAVTGRAGLELEF